MASNPISAAGHELVERIALRLGLDIPRKDEQFLAGRNDDQPLGQSFPRVENEGQHLAEPCAFFCESLDNVYVVDIDVREGCAEG